MPDVIPGARYRDGVLGIGFTCNGVVETPHERMVVAEYDRLDDTIRIPYDLFTDDERITLIEQP